MSAIPKTTKKTKARKSFDYQCKKASRCRRDRYYASCCACPDEDICRIQKDIDKAKQILVSE